MTDVTVPDRAVYWDLVDFLYKEASLLDHDRLEEWLELLSPDIEYKMPTRATVSRADGNGFLGEMGHFDENFASLTMRVRRLVDTHVAWAEDPPSRARRFVSNVTVKSFEGDTAVVCSYLLVLRSRGDSPTFEIISAEREDVLRNVADNWRIERRTIFVDQSTLGSINLALFL